MPFCHVLLARLAPRHSNSSTEAKSRGENAPQCQGKERPKDCLRYLGVCRSMGCIEGDVWCDCGATLCHLGSFLKAGRRQMFPPPLERARRSIQRTTDQSAYTAPGMIKEQVALKVISRQNDGQGSDWE